MTYSDDERDPTPRQAPRSNNWRTRALGNDRDEDTIWNAATSKVNMPSGAVATVSKPVDFRCICDNDGERVRLPQIHRGWLGGDEYKTVIDEMHKTLGAHNFKSYDIISIIKVQNCCLWERFRNKERQIAKELRYKYVNEVMLFHGTSAAETIVRTGFDVAAANPDGMFGPGIYFAENSSKSNRYAAGYVGHRKMILCRVALGKMLDRTKADKMRRPPSGYHSVRGVPAPGGLLYPEYVVYHNDQAYPEYVVSYNIVV